MYSELTYLKNEEKYRNLFEREYCQKEIITCHNIVVKFYARHFDHAFFSRSNRRSNKKDVFDSNRAQRILWIKQVLQDNNIPIYQGHNSKTKKSDKSRRVSLLTPDGYVVVIRMTGEDKAEFLTAFVINDSAVIGKIRSNSLIYDPT
ncbi:hypothetical protein [Staphylococcus haemolyticus]|uniref:hypothetical protein n=1 Tax=Staphylococcus haemolyticus TaxID=1283 RepID=UPI0011A571B0|nr:hypothetical protein [Staphylococcus haemolyticus]